MTAAQSRWDLAALGRGAVVSLAVTVPPTLIARALVDDEDSTSGWAPILLVVTLVGFALGGAVAARRQDRGTPLSHAVVTAGAVFVIVQATFIVYRLTEGKDISLGRVLVAFSFSLAAGLVGGVIGNSARANRRPA